MTQRGLYNSANVVIDQLSYTYQSGSNKLAKVTDAAAPTTGLGDFNNGTNSGDDYAYDFNGNLTKDRNKNIDSIQYNFLNLPKQITVAGKGNILYQYDAADNKLSKTVSETGQSQKVTTYLGNLIFENNVLQHVATEEGRARLESGIWKFDYFLKDHLGNVRMMLADNGTVLEEAHYYPFGLTMKGNSTQQSSTTLQNKYLYNGKEQQQDLGLDSYDYGARMYNAQIGRWLQPDPLSEKYFGVSPYNYTLNNPISLFDIDGRDAIVEFDYEEYEVDGVKKKRISGIRISSTIYFSGGSKRQRDEYAKAGNDAFKKYNKLFSDEDGIKVSISLEYKNIDVLNGGEIGAGNNEMSLDDLDSERQSQMSGGPAPIVNDYGKRIGYEPDYLAGNFGYLRSGSKDTRFDNRGKTILHESLHLLGLSDRYSRIKSEAAEGTVRGGGGRIMASDIMAYGVSHQNVTMSSLHYQNLRNYIINPPQAQQQYNQSKSQFILKYVVDGKADNRGNLNLIN